MDYKYIEQLLSRYWECQTTLEEEAILRAFFAQSDVPASLLPYRTLFQAEEEMRQEPSLSEDFEARMLRLVGQRPAAATTRARRLTMAVRLRPLFQAAAMVAVVLALGLAAQRGWEAPAARQASVALQPGDSVSSPQVADEATAGLAPQRTDSLPASPESYTQ